MAEADTSRTVRAVNKVAKVETFENVPKTYYFQYQGEPHNYFFEIVEGERDNIISTIKCPYVSKITGDPQPASVLTFTNSHMYEEHEGYRQRVFTLVGRSGFTPADIQNFQRFRNFFETLQQLKGENLNAFVRGRDIRLVLNFPFEGESYYCNVIRGLAYDRDRSSITYSYVWMLTVVTTGYVARRWTVPNRLKEFLDTECGPESDGCHTGRLHPCRRMAEITRADLPTEANPLADLVDISVPICDEIERQGGLGSRTNTRSYERLNIVSNTMYESAVQWVRSLDVFTFDQYVYQAIDIIGWASNLRMEAQLYRGANGEEIANKVANAVTGGLWGQVRQSLELLESVGQRGDVRLVNDRFYPRPGPDLTIQNNQPDDARTQTPVTSVELGPYDVNVYELAFRLYSDPTIGASILALNANLADARTWVGGYPLKPGDKLLVPMIGGLADKDGPPLGIDWKVEEFDFVWDDIKGDFVKVSGRECYLQNTRHRLSTPKGTNRAFRETGVSPIVDEDGQRSTMAVVSDVQQQVLLDPRTKKILKLDYREDGTTVYVDVLAELVNSDAVGISYSQD